MTLSTRILLVLIGVVGAVIALANLHTVSGNGPYFMRVNNLTGYTEICVAARCLPVDQRPAEAVAAPPRVAPEFQKYLNTIPCSRKDAADLKAKGYDRLANDFLYNC